MTRLNHTISRVLLIGLIAAILLLLAGAVLTIARPGLEPVRETRISDIPGAVGALEPGGFFDLGLLLLLATPIARVVALLIGFARRRMWLFSGFSAVVLAALALSIFLGLRAG